MGDASVKDPSGLTPLSKVSFQPDSRANARIGDPDARLIFSGMRKNCASPSGQLIQIHEPRPIADTVLARAGLRL